MEILFLIVGLVAGWLLTINMSRDRAVGTLWVDKSVSEDQPAVYLQLYEDVSDISSRERVSLKVEVVKLNNSQK